MFTNPSKLTFAVALACAASLVLPRSVTFAADEPNLLPGLAEEEASHLVVGTVAHNWNDQRQRDEYTITDERDHVRYTILSGAGVDRTELVGQRIALDGRTRVHDERNQGLIYPRQVRILPRDIQRASLLVDSDSPGNVNHLPTEININVAERTLPNSLGPAPPGQRLPDYAGPGFAGTGIQLPGFPLPGVGPACESCGRGGFFNGGNGGLWGRVEYLYWKTSGMELPALVTTSPDMTARDDAGVLGITGTQTLLGGNEILDDARHGGRVRVGAWLGPNFGLDVDYLRLSNEATGFAANTDTHAILAVPFFNVNPRDPMNPALFAPAREDAYLISYPTVASGSVAVSAENRFESGGVRALLKLAGHATGINCPEDRRVDLIFGYRTLQLRDQLAMRAQLTTLNGTNQTFDINDSFSTKNTFHGIETGAQVQGHWQRVSYEFLAKVALGNASQEVSINGNTDITVVGAGTTAHAGGLFAQTSNIGNYSRDQFTVVPELSATLGFKITKRLRGTLGYNFIYWGRVLRAGDQIDREINQDLLPPAAMPLTGPQRPELAVRDTSFWAQGLTAGLDFRW